MQSATSDRHLVNSLANRQYGSAVITRSILLWLSFVAPWCSYCQVVASDISADKGVYANDFIRNTFYTWTTAEQIDELAKNKVLLTKSRSETKGYSQFDISIRDSTLKDNLFAQLLQEERFAKKRFAWTNSWATIMGWKGETYGHHLIKIVLSDSAIIGTFDLSETEEPLAFFDMQGRKLTSDTVLRNKHRIAAIYHVSHFTGTRTEWKNTGTYHGPGKWENHEAKVPFREYVIVNEGMIEDWSYGTSDTENRILAEVELLERFRRSKEVGQKAYRRWSYPWTNYMSNAPGDQPAVDSRAAFDSFTCFNNDYYLFNRKRLRRIIAQLRSALTEGSGTIRKENAAHH